MINETEFYKHVMQFELDDPEAAYNFTQRLAKENNWSMGFALHAVFEYKRFMFLIVSTGQMLSPSEVVDQVWHLHLLYTKSYWDDFCGAVLKRPVHHIPSLGGKQEREKYATMYEKTINIYQNIFGQIPPNEIWPPANEGKKHAAYKWEKLTRLFMGSLLRVGKVNKINSE